LLTVEHYNKQGQDAYFKPDGDKFLVYRKSDNKTLKSVNYSEASLANILAA